MSLINDALQRAKNAQQNNPPPVPPLQFRPLDPVQAPRKGIGLVFPATLGTVLVIGIISYWLMQHRGSPQAPAAPQAAAEQAPVSTPAPTRPVEPVAVAPVAKAPVAPTTPTAPAADFGSTAGTQSSVSNSITADVVAAKPAPTRLQAIVYNPVRPSAIINGKTVFVGDHIGEFHVTAITAQTATLASTTQTNVLELE